MDSHSHSLPSTNLPIIPRTALCFGPGLLSSVAGLLVLRGMGTGPAALCKETCLVGLRLGSPLGSSRTLGWVLRTAVVTSTHTAGTGTEAGGSWLWYMDGKEGGGGFEPTPGAVECTFSNYFSVRTLGAQT